MAARKKPPENTEPSGPRKAPSRDASKPKRKRAPARREQGKHPKGTTGKVERGAPKPHETIPIVGIGSSAGGLEALQELLGPMPTDTGMAFVVVTHQHAGRVSLLPELLRK